MFCSPVGNFVDHVSLTVYHLMSFLKHVSPLAVGAVGRLYITDC